MDLFSKTAHIQLIEEIAAGMQAAGMNHRYLELGVLKASCLNRITPYFDECTGVDINDFAKWVISRNVINFIGTTDNFFLKNTKKYNFIFIDACHKYENVLRDFRNAWMFLEKNGLIIMHDTYSPSPEYDEHCMDAYKINQWLYENNIPDRQFITLPFFYGLTIVRRVN
jgi:hypothetical protein